MWIRTLSNVRHSSEIEAIVRRFVAAAAQRDIDLVRGLVSTADEVFVVGSDRGEWERGPSALAMMAHHWDLLEPYGSQIHRIEAVEHGEVGWAAVEETRIPPDADPLLVRVTFVFYLEGGSWKLAHIHFSLPVDNRDALGVEITRSLSELLDSVEAEPGRAFPAPVAGTSTFLFTDVVDSTRRSEEMGDTAWSRLISSHFDATSAIVASHGGTTVKTLGDGGMYAFATGSAALKSAVEIQQSVADGRGGLSLRIGVHTGDVVVDRDDYLGVAVAKAARIASAAQGEQILVSATTAGLVNAQEFAFDAPHRLELKGISGTHEVLALNWS